MKNNKPLQTVAFSALALIAFAANSVLCRLALGTAAIDAASFTIVRLLSGAMVLFALVAWQGRHTGPSPKGNWVSGLMLFVYAITFSFAYISLDTGTGALILFGSVQITMVSLSFFSGKRLHAIEFLGLMVAFVGFAYLILPSVSSPSLIGFGLMSASGVAWGIYTFKGRGSKNPLTDTAYNFLWTIPLVIMSAVVTMKGAHYSVEGLLLAVLSGGIASGVGYAVWYVALSGLSVVQAAVIQLLVPVIAALGGVVFVDEMLTYRLMLSAALVLGGILLVVLGRYGIEQVQRQVR